LHARCTVAAHKFSQHFVYVKYVIKQIVYVAVKHIISPDEFVLDEFLSDISNYRRAKLINGPPCVSLTDAQAYAVL